MTSQDFDSLLTDVVFECLSDLLGSTAAQAFNFYIDPKLASKNPTAYVSKLQSFTGQVASEIIVGRISNSLSQRLGMKRVGSRAGFSNLIQTSKTLFVEQSPSKF